MKAFERRFAARALRLRVRYLRAEASRTQSAFYRKLICRNVHHRPRPMPSTDFVRDILPTRGSAGRSWMKSGSTRGRPGRPGVRAEAAHRRYGRLAPRLFSNGSREEAHPDFDALGYLCSLRARLALDGVSWAQGGEVENAVGRWLAARNRIGAVVCSLPRASLLAGAGAVSCLVDCRA
jgi:hypothetical protein